MAATLSPAFNTKELGGHRSNSLAFSKHDCHTCAALKERCDRQRPRCGTCVADRRKCGGFAMNLVWKDLATTGPAAPSPRCRGSEAPHCQTEQQRPSRKNSLPLKFVRGHPKRRRGSKQAGRNLTPRVATKGSKPQSWMDPVTETSEEIPQSSYDSTDSSANIARDTAFGIAWQDDVLDVEAVATNITLQAALDWPTPVATENRAVDSSSEDMMLVPYTSVSPFWECGTLEINVISDASSPSSTPRGQHDGAHSPPDSPSSLVLGVPYRSLAHKYSDVLTLYDREFCVLPLTWDCKINPFRVRQEQTEKSLFLLHAVMAVSMQHLAKQNGSLELSDEMHKHWSSSIQLFSGALHHSNVYTLLDTLLVLISLETTQSASGSWGLHLDGAMGLLEKYGSVAICRQSPRLRVQIAMLVWWDVTTALVSRREPRFPLEYVEMLNSYGESDGFSYFGLNGCPLELLVIMYRLARLVVTYEKTTEMEWAIFNRLPVDNLIKDVKNLINETAIGLDDIENLEEDANARRNRYHCIEAWRHAILLYICRVFNPRQDTYQLRQIDHLSRVVLDSVRCIPETDIIQKQLLLPVFLAASEVGDERNRSLVRYYLKHWSDTSRFYHFESVTAILEQVWSGWDETTRDEYWWGMQVPRGGWVSGDNQAMVSELMLG